MTVGIFFTRLSIFLQIFSSILGLNFDNQLVIIANDCYTRISIGTRLPDDGVFRTIQVQTVSECEDECSKNRSSCNVFSFGIDSRGNGTCILSSLIPRPEELKLHQDYDVYVRTQSSVNCEPDRLYKLGSASGNRFPPAMGLPMNGVNTKNRTGNIFSIHPIKPDSNSKNNRRPGIFDTENPRTGNRYFLEGVDEDRRFFDISRNKNPPLKNHNYYDYDDDDDDKNNHFYNYYFYPKPKHRFYGSDFHSEVYHEKSKSSPDFHNYGQKLSPVLKNAPEKKYFDFGFGTWKFDTSNGFPGGYWGSYDNQFPQNYNNYGQGNQHNWNFGNGNRSLLEKMYDKKSHVDKDGSFGIRIPQKLKPCYRRLLAGKKINSNYVRRAMDCERLEDCHRHCELEKHFFCEGFNYRHPPPGSPGTCEFTSVSPPRVDVHRDFLGDPDYDYYERDRNCPEDAASRRPVPPDPPRFLPRPPDFHEPHNRRRYQGFQDFGSDFPYERPISTPSPAYIPSRGGSKPHYYYYSWNYPRIRDEDRYYQQREFSNKFPKFDQRQNEISSRGGNLQGGGNRLKDFYGDNFDAGSSNYGGSYGYDWNFHPGKDLRHPPAAGTGHDDATGSFYGTPYGYGGAYGYGNGENSIPRHQDHGEVPYLPGNRMECSYRFAAGFRLARGTIRKVFLTSNLDQCESLCVNEKEFLCMSFTYRYTVASTDPTDNCLLSELSFKDLNFYTDLEPDRNYDIYELNGDVKACMEKPNNERPPDECFWRVKSGFGVPPEIVKKSVTVGNLGDCQIECTMIQDFTCRSFVFRFGTRNNGNNYQFSNNNNNNDNNCFLTDYPSREINPATLSDLDGAELYERGSFGRGCERYPFPLYEPGRFPNFGNNDVDNKHLSFGGGSAEGGDVCYNEHHKPCKLAPVAILLSIRVETEADCRRKCNHMRDRDPVPCMSYSYRLGDPDRGPDENCLLSDVPQRDLRPGYDYINDDKHVLYSWKELDQQCLSFGNDFPSSSRKPDMPYFPDSSGYPLGDDYGTPFYSGVNQEAYDGMKPIYGPIYPTRGRGRGFQFRPSGQNPEIRPYDPDRPDPPTSAQPGGEKFFSFGPNLPFGPNNEWSTFQRYTVNGYPCKRGSRCERNKVAGFWSCETEGGELGAWDYCCEPNHRCGYSQGYNYPWCYVGHSKDQWRPCSNEYFPYLPSPRPKGIESRDSSHGRRHWPVAYLHRESPPVSSTSDSIISANDRRERNFIKGGKRSSKSSRSRIGRRQVARLQEPDSPISRNLTFVPGTLGSFRKFSNASSIDPQIFYTKRVSVSFPRVENRKEEKSEERKAVIERVSRPIFSSRTREEFNGTNIGSDLPRSVKLKEIRLIPSPSNSSSVS